MPPNNREKRARLVLIALLVVSQAYFGSITSVAAATAEHSHIVFQDNFEDGEAGDWMIDMPPDPPPGTAWAVQLDDGNYVLRETGPVWAETGDFTWTDYTFEVKVKIRDPTSGGQINFRLAWPSRYFLNFGNGGLYLQKNTDPEFAPEYLNQREPGLNPNKWYTIKIICIGNSIEIYVDDLLKLSYVDEEDPILLGRIGIEGWGNILSVIYFDDVKVSTTHRLYVTYLIEEAQDEINKARMIDADTVEAEGKLAEARDAFDNGALSVAESLAKETINLAQHAPVGHISVGELLEYSAEYNKHTVEIWGTIEDIQYAQGVYSFAVDDGTAVISATFNGTLEEIKSEDEVKVVGMFDASTRTVIAESLEKMRPPTEGLYTFLIFKDDFEDGDFADWSVYVDPEIEGSAWEVEMENGNHVLSGEGHVCSDVGDPEWTDYTLEFKIKLIKGTVFVNLRVTATGEHPERYILHLSHAFLRLSKGMVYLKKQIITDLKRVDIALDPDTWYHMKIVCLENNIGIYLNDYLKIDYTDEDNPHLSGHIGFEPLSSSHVLFDDVKVSKIATTSVINDLITYAQSEIDRAKEINADVSAAELKLEQAQQALDQEDYQMVQYFVDEAVWLAKRASVGQISITNLKAMATKCNDHVVTITGRVKNLEASYGVGYNFALDDGTGRISVTYQGVLIDIGNDYKVTVTGIFDAPTGTVSASRIEKIAGAPTSPPSGITWSIELVTVFITVSGAAVATGGWVLKTRRVRKRKKILFKKLMDDVDDVYSRFKMNTLRCQAELYKLRDQVLEEFKQGLIDEEKYDILNERVDNFLKEVEEEIAKKRAS